MNQKKILKRAIVLLLIALMISSSGVVSANTFTSALKMLNKETRTATAPVKRGLLWDNVLGVHGISGGVIVSTARPDGVAFSADDFELDTTTPVNKVVWQGGYFQCEQAQGFKDYDWDWRVIFWEDFGDGTKPGNLIYNQTIPTANIQREHWYDFTNTSSGREYWVANYSATIPVSPTFTAGTKYWITVQGVGAYPPQACWSRHNESVGGIKLHQAKFKGGLWGYTDWTDISSLTWGLPHDLNYQLYYETDDTTPPTTICNLNGTQSGGVYITDVTATLSATDDMSGVNKTMYKVDSGIFTQYSIPVLITGNGAHKISFYSIDNAGNIEQEKNRTFTIQYPVELSITIKGGLGVKATIKNIGTTNLTNISWNIALDGKMIFLGKNKPGTIASLAIGESYVAKDFVIGFGKTGIAVTAGSAAANTTGTVLLFLVVGVK